MKASLKNERIKVSITGECTREEFLETLRILKIVITKSPSEEIGMAWDDVRLLVELVPCDMKFPKP